MTTPAPLLFLDSGRVLQSRCLLSSLTPKCFISPAQPCREGQSLLSCASLLCGRAPGGTRKHRAGLVALRGLEHRFQVWVLVSTHPLPPNQTNAALSDLLWPLRHVLFLTPSWNWLSSSKNQVPRSSLSPYLTPVPCEERVNIFFIYLVFFLCVLGWVCVWSQGVSCGHPRLGAYLAALDLGPTILPLAPLTPLGSYQPPFTRATLPPEHVFRTCH